MSWRIFAILKIDLISVWGEKQQFRNSQVCGMENCMF